ncbi:hypothetical protein Bbelb_184190 [Branchiostoma belcheri]|nr:hypothetical protein Bbelb_184190 [Branchiostoma belcheri]
MKHDVAWPADRSTIHMLPVHVPNTEPIDSTQRLTVGIKFFHREQGSFEFCGPLSWTSGLRVLPRSGTLNKENIRSAGEHNIAKNTEEMDDEWTRPHLRHSFHIF